ncbi:MAG: AMP-binding protein [Lachnospiraceae bacterium]|nr:AMP-binding protein [Lachnospiraceae bacterium]
MIWNESRECISRDELIDLQGSRLVKLVKHMYYGTEYYRKKMQQQGIEPGDIHGLEDLDKLPFTTREDLENFCSFDTHTADVWSECAARTICMSGLSGRDKILAAYPYGLSAGAPGICSGAEKTGAAAVPFSISNSSKLAAMMKESGATAVMCTPAYLMRIARMAEEYGLLEQLQLKTAICSAEPWQESARKQLQTKLGIRIYDIYGLGEFAEFGAAGECRFQNGMHVQEDYYIPEVIDPRTQRAVPDGQKGELVLTSLCNERIPLIRYRTADITSISHNRCRCGRTTARLERISGRTQQQLFIRGKQVSSGQLETALMQLEDIRAVYRVSVKREHHLDTVEVLIGPDEPDGTLPADEEEAVKRRVAGAVRDIIGIMPNTIVAKQEKNRYFDGRKVTVIDKRTYN